MFSGIQEILVLVVIAVGLLVLPRVMPRSQKEDRRHAAVSRSLPALSGRLRLAIVLSLLWPGLCAVYLEPWHKELVAYLAIGVAPVILAWGVRWILLGFKKPRRF